MGQSYSIGPGFAAFVVFFFIAVALWLLMRNMSGRLRRMSYEERAERMRREQAERDASPRTPESRAEAQQSAEPQKPAEGEDA